MALRLLAPQFLLVYCFAAAGLYVHYRGKVRHAFFRQLTDHSTLMAPYNALMYLFSAVPNRPVLPTSDLPELAKLRENWQTIREEALQLFDEGHIRAAAKYNDWGFNSFFRSGWKRFYLKWYEDFLPSAATMCPKTVELLHTMPTVHGAMFAMLSPGGRLVAHRDPFAGSLRYHLGLVTPKGSEPCRIFVDGEKVGFVNKAFAFIYPIRLVGKRMKAWNRKVYYAVKYSLVAALLAAILIPTLMR